MRVESRAPARVDMAGGTVDIWPLYLFHPGAQTVNIAIRNYASSIVETRSDRRITLISRDQKVEETFGSFSDLARGRSSLPLLRELVLFFEPRRGGAGGGGCVVFLVEAGTKPRVETQLTRLGGQIINFAVSRTGLEVRSDDSEPHWKIERTERR